MHGASHKTNQRVGEVVLLFLRRRRLGRCCRNTKTQREEQANARTTIHFTQPRAESECSSNEYFSRTTALSRRQCIPKVRRVAYCGKRQF